MRSTVDLTTSDFKLTFADRDFIWSGKAVPGLPLLRWPNGDLCEPVLYFFGHSAIENRVAMKSMRPEAYALREWLVFLWNKGINLLDVNDKLLEQFRREQGWPDADPFEKAVHRKRKDTPSIARTKRCIERKCHQIFEFYRLLPVAMPFEDGGARTPTFTGRALGTQAYPLTAKVAWNARKKQEYLRWVRSERIFVIPRPPIAATENEVVRLYGNLRQHAFRVQSRLKLDQPTDKDWIVSDRNWLIANVMAKAGLRCEEVSDLTVHQLAAALNEAGITDEVIDLDAVFEEELQKKISARILSLKKGEEYAFLSVTTIGKGGKTRSVPFPPSLVVDLLIVGVWGCRRKQLNIWRSSDPRFVSPSALFLSQQTRSQMDEGSIGDIIGKAFRDCRIKKGAHKLRGYFATVTAAALWNEYFAGNQYRFDQALVNKVLDELARALGHAQITTTVKFYLDKQLFAHLTKIGSPQAQLFRRLWDTLVMGKNELSERSTTLLSQIMARLAATRDDSMLIEVLETVLKDERLASAEPVKRKLTVVPSVERLTD
ncbi:site-specific integrase [Neorhizobium galegae]|uniref:Site-specific integrase n=1 Tax=Neorhizobium galegae TaxID=399 RepID=A0A6A1TLT4_NEOGA|nr:site-specific integrase [Neorhizobium galegae]KAB1085791.1 site-specific integrase [Neorhizobium galegae]